MRHRTLIAAVLTALLLTACGGSDIEPAASGDAPAPTTTVAAGSQSDGGTDATAGTDTPAVEPSEGTADPAERPAPDPNRQLAPDFTLALGDGTDFTLSNELRPVFMVFWAEW